MFKFFELPYSSNALEPVLSQKAVDTHYEKHHKGYYNNLEKLIKGTMFEDMSLEKIVREAKNPSMFNNAAQVFNHNFYWQSLTPVGEKVDMPDNLKQALETTYDTIDHFKHMFLDRAAKHFASGWVWLVRAEDEVEVWTLHDADTPITKENVTPLLTVDLWEHAFYQTYEHDKSSYLENIYDVLNWEFANEQLIKSMK
jgi:Fe-Mn family superoxide dismutase